MTKTSNETSIQKTSAPKKMSLSNQKAKDQAAIFAGSADLVRAGSRDERDMVLKVAKAFALPAICVGVQGGLPYINKDGLLFKLTQYYPKGIVSMTSKAIQYSLKKGERAIFETVLVLRSKEGKEQTFNAVGEADDESVKLKAVQATPNLMAETRSQNRCIRRAIQAQMLSEMFKSLGTKEDAVELQTAISSSVEEMERPPIQIEEKKAVVTVPAKAPTDYIAKLEEGLERRGNKTATEKAKYIRLIAGMGPSYAYTEAVKRGMTQKEAQALIGQIALAEANKK